MDTLRLAIEGQLNQECNCLSIEEIDSLQNTTENEEVEFVKDLDEAEKAMGVVGALEDLAFIAQSTEEVTPREAALIQIAADASMLGTGVDSSVIFPSMEEIESGSSIGSRIKEVVKRILEEIARIMKAIKKNIESFLLNHKKLNTERRLQVKKLLSEVKNSQNIDNSSSFKVRPFYTVSKNGDVNIHKSSSMISALSDHVKGSQKYLKIADNYIQNMVSITGNFYKAISANNKDVLAKNASWLSNNELIGEFLQLSDSKRNINGIETTAGFLFGGTVNISIGGRTTKSTDTDSQIASTFQDNISKSKVHMTALSVPVDPVRMDTFKRNESIKLLEHCLVLIDNCDDINKTLTARQEDITTLIRVIEKSTEESIIDNDAKIQLPYLSMTSAVVRKLETIPIYALTYLNSLNAKVIRQVLHVVTESLNVHKAK